MPRLNPNKAIKSRQEQQANNGLPTTRAVPSWKPHLSQYSEQRILIFSSRKDLDAAIDLLWAEELRGLPHETPDGKSLVIPAEAVDYFRRAGLRFIDKKVPCVSELPIEKIRQLRG